MQSLGHSYKFALSIVLTRVTTSVISSEKCLHHHSKLSSLVENTWISLSNEIKSQKHAHSDTCTCDLTCFSHPKVAPIVGKSRQNCLETFQCCHLKSQFPHRIVKPGRILFAEDTCKLFLEFSVMPVSIILMMCCKSFLDVLLSIFSSSTFLGD